MAAAGVGATTGSASGEVAARGVLARGLVSPLTAGVADNGTAYVSENFAGLLVKIRPGHKPRPVFQAKKGVEVGGVTVDPGTVTFSLTFGSGQEAPVKRSLVMHLSHGKATRFANTGAFERNNNPDAGVTYGFRHLNKRCLAKVPKRVPARYSGIVDSHPYSTATTGGTTYVGDAAGNDILRVNGNGHIRLVSVLPPVPLRVTKHRAKANGMPACAVGHRYWFEPVPTDVEVAPSGGLVVTTLTGATEAPGFGGQSRVYRVDPATGRASLVTRGLAGAVGLAITTGGDYLVSQLFGNELSRVDASTGGVSHVRNVSQPAAVERVGGKVYVTSRVLAKKPMGRLLRFPG
nr:ScyD/ScyE family protein [Nocardioides panaciterrulae]